MSNRTRQTLSLTALFAASLFLLTASLWLGTQRTALLLAPEARGALYACQQLLTAAGFGCFSLTRLLPERLRRLPEVLALPAWALAVGVLLFTDEATLSVGAGCCGVFLAGLLGASVSWRVSLLGRGWYGRVLGLGAAMAYGLQYVFQLWPAAQPFLPGVMALALAVLAVGLLRSPEPALPAPVADAAPAPLKFSLLAEVGITLALLLLNCFFDGVLFQVHAAAQVDSLTELPRLLLIPGSLFFGFLADCRDGRYLPLAALCTVLLTLLNPALVGTANTYPLNLSLFYLGVSAALSYYTLTFWRLAPRTRCPALWASMGRILDGLLGGLLALAGYSRVSPGLVLFLDLFLLAFLIVSMSLHGDLALARQRTPASDPAGPAPDPTPPEQTPPDLTLLRSRYGLTDRETEVLREWLLTEDSQTEIADRMCISVSTLRGHVAALYRKTGVNSRGKLRRLAAQPPDPMD